MLAKILVAHRAWPDVIKDLDVICACGAEFGGDEEAWAQHVTDVIYPRIEDSL